MTYFLINPASKKRGRKAAKRRKRRVALKRKANGQFVKRAKSARRRVRRTKAGAKGGGITVAKRRRRRVRHAAAPRRRRRRRSVVVLRSNPRRRRRRHHITHRRRYRRNPGLGGGVVSTIKQGVKDGFLVLVGQAAQGRASALAGKFVPIGGIAGEAVTGLGSAVVVTLAARKFAPGAARIIAAGAFSNAVKRLVAAVSPGAASLLGDSDYMSIPTEYYDQGGGVGAYPGAGELGMGAYPGGGLGDNVDEYGTQYIS